MSSRKGIEVKIRIASDIEDSSRWEIGERILNHLVDTEPRLTPQRMGECEPFRVVWDGVDSALPVWNPWEAEARGVALKHIEGLRGFLWRRRKTISSSGNMDQSFVRASGTLRWADLRISATPRGDVDWVTLFRGWCDILPPVLAALHVRTLGEHSVKDPPYDYLEARKTDPWRSSQIWSWFRAGPSQDCLEKNGYIPNLWWGTVFGPEHAADVDWDGIAAAGFAVEDLGGGKFVRVTDDLFDVGENWPHFSAERARLKALFPKGKFKIEDEPDIDPEILAAEG